jgi:hypothetical protein
VDVNEELYVVRTHFCGFSDLSYCFLIDSNIICLDLSVFDIPDFTNRNLFFTFPFFLLTE